MVAYKSANNQEALDDIEIIVDATSDTLRIETKLPSDKKGWFGGSNNGARVTYELSVPASVNLDDIESVNGGIDISGVYGNIKADTVNGSIEVEDASADARLETVNGGIYVSFTALTGDQVAKLESVNGRIAVELPANADASVSAETMNGGMDGKDFGLSYDKGIVGKDMNGDIGDGSARLSIDTVNGGIKIRER